MSRSLLLPLLAATLFTLTTSDADAQRRANRRSCVMPLERRVDFLTSVDSIARQSLGLPQKVRDAPAAEDEEAFGSHKSSADLDRIREADKITIGLNKARQCEAYPFLSADGLRMYFTSNRGVSHGRVYLATRTAADQPFAAPKPLSSQLPDPYYCGSLTADELTIYVAKQGEIFVSQRRSLSEEFGAPVKVELGKLGWSFAPGISPDGQELVITTTIGDRKGEVNIVYRKTENGRFVQSEILASPEGSDAGPAQFSKDGLSIYCSRENDKDKDEKLYRYRRSALGARFVEVEELPADLQLHHQCLQPSVNGDETLLAYVVSNGTWDEDDIVIVPMKERRSPVADTHVGDGPDSMNIAPPVSNNASETGRSIAVEPKINPARAVVYPNPFQHSLVFELNVMPEANTVFTLFDLQGRQLRQQRIAGQKTVIEAGNLPAGTYFYHVTNGGGKLISSGKLIRN